MNGTKVMRDGDRPWGRLYQLLKDWLRLLQLHAKKAKYSELDKPIDEDLPIERRDGTILSYN